MIQFLSAINCVQNDAKLNKTMMKAANNHTRDIEHHYIGEQHKHGIDIHQSYSLYTGTFNFAWILLTLYITVEINSNLSFKMSKLR